MCQRYILRVHFLLPIEKVPKYLLKEFIKTNFENAYLFYKFRMCNQDVRRWRIHDKWKWIFRKRMLWWSMAVFSQIIRCRCSEMPPRVRINPFNKKCVRKVSFFEQDSLFSFCSCLRLEYSEPRLSFLMLCLWIRYFSSFSTLKVLWRI